MAVSVKMSTTQLKMLNEMTFVQLILIGLQVIKVLTKPTTLCVVTTAIATYV